MMFEPPRESRRVTCLGQVAIPGAVQLAQRRLHEGAPVFADGILADDRRTRDPVAAAQPTARARHKEVSRCIDDGAPLHSLDTLLGALATRCRNTCRIPADPSARPCLCSPSRPQPSAAYPNSAFNPRG